MAWPVRRKDAAVNCNINVTPMVDVMLVLLIIFMVVLPIIHEQMPVDMAKVDHPQDMPDAGRDTAIIVAITKSNRIYLKTEPVTLQDLGPKIHDLLEKTSDDGKKVYVRADARAKYSDVADTVDTLRSAGVDDLGLLTDKRDDPTAAPKP
jgi:biopolymer transport protein TolR